ncbi:MAG TPA: hypothetical protein PKM65_01895 [Spirochaetota bacterium]|nr:hypothetical protein [Spirochaetota bacterium]HNT12605.1 hypothetical protein [Spirochaetota bacterium]HNV47428.1 hypothetical protein [Spirochaetota bacterium]HOS39183.1 hypothetical protein [Spirochaetota bacterium]HPI23048.1 hypothetical protein [Spirochaetota bacterium]
MIKLKTGREVQYNQNFDLFFQSLLAAVIQESRRVAAAQRTDAPEPASNDEAVLREIMDNSIYIAHQIMELKERDENLARFLVTGCLFNCAVLTLPHLPADTGDAGQSAGEDNIH